MLNLLIVIIIAFISLSTFSFYQKQRLVGDLFAKDHPLIERKLVKKDGRIFISIASYRDPETPKTVEDLINKAEHPELLNIVVYEQNDPDDPSCLPGETVKLLKDHFSEAKGPTWARYKIQREYDGQEYFMQIDSHSRVVSNWDTEMKKMLNLLPEKSVLTQYPPEYSIEDGSYDLKQVRSGLYIQGFGVIDRFTRIQSDIIKSDELLRNYPYTSKGWAACFSFSKGDIVNDAPYDPYLPHLFFGEELDITLRLFTRGWNFYSPHKNLIFTCFKRTHRRTYWQDASYWNRKFIEAASRYRLCKRLGLDFVPEYFFLTTTVEDEKLLKNSDKFKLGTDRTLGDYEQFAQIEDLNTQKIDKTAKTFRRFTKRPLRR